LNRWQLITMNADEEVWDLAEQVIEREWLDDGRMRWVLDTEASEETIRDSVPSIVSVEAMERPEEPEEGGEGEAQAEAS
jgi:hypothetical protein